MGSLNTAVFLLSRLIPMMLQASTFQNIADSTPETLELLQKNISFHGSDVWYGESMQHVDWPLVFKEMAPFLSYTDRNILMETSETDGVSPCLLLTAAIYYKSEKRSNFRTFIEDISGRVVNAFFNSINRTKKQKEKENDAKRTVSLFVHKDLKQTSEVMFILNSVKTEAEKCRKVYKEKYSNIRGIKRGASNNIILRFPFKTSECWMLSATHPSNKQCIASACPKSSLDMAPNLFMGFGHGFEYFNSQGEVVAAHSGEVHVVSPCKLLVKSLKITTFYSHIDISRSSGEYVRVGEHLGFIQLDRESANCNCEVSDDRTECSTGPHLHWEIRDSTNKPMDLNGMVISGYRIHTGTDSYDVGCGPENCHSNMTVEEIDRSCSTIFHRIADNVTFCPSVQGANWGGGYSHGSNIVNKPPLPQPPINGDSAIKYDISSEHIPNPGYKCTHHSCPWSEYQKDVHWGIYTEMGANITGCELCMAKCDHNMSCGSVECGEDQSLLDGTVVKAYCSWWRKGSCETPEEFSINPADYIWTCKKKDCKWSHWSDWTACSATCGNGTKTRSRTRYVEDVNGGIDCPGEEENDNIDCNESACPECSDSYPSGMTSLCKRSYDCKKLASQNNCQKSYQDVLSRKCKKTITGDDRSKLINEYCVYSCDIRCPNFRILRKMDTNWRHSIKRSSQYFDQTRKVSTFSKVPLSDNSSADSHNLLGKGIPSGFDTLQFSTALTRSSDNMDCRCFMVNHTCMMSSFHIQTGPLFPVFLFYVVNPSCIEFLDIK